MAENESTQKIRYKRGMNPNSRAALRPFQPGDHSVPRPGRPRQADCLIGCIKEELAALSPNGKSTNEQLIASVLVAKATGGDMRAIELLASYTTPKPAQGINIGDAEGKVIKSTFNLIMPDGSMRTPQDYVKDSEAKAVDNNSSK